MLHYDHSITKVAQFLQRMDKSVIVPLMQANAWFIQDIQHIDQLGANLRGEPYALALAS